jgi:GH25 family lysozyme M1 (1,4-beta-N-acetylmuramidase)
VTTNFADLSHHQSAVDLAAYARAGHDRVMLKATEGLSVVDARFAERWQQAGRLRLARVAYHFGRAGNSGAAEFDHLLQVVGGLGARDALCLDSEDTSAPGRAAAHAREFTARAVARGVRTGLVYTGRWFAEPNGITAAVVQPGWRQLWLSDYGTAPDGGIALPTGWSRAQLVARQFTDHATVPGITGGCDYNRVLADWIDNAPPEDDVTLTAAQAATLADIAAGVNDLQAKMDRTRDVTLLNMGNRQIAAQAALDAQAKTLAALGVVVGAQADDEAKLTAAVTAAVGGAEQRIIDAVRTVIIDPQVDNNDPQAFVVALRDALARGTAHPEGPA